VTIQSDPKYRLNTESLNNVYVRTDSGEEHVFTGEVSVHGIYGAV